MCKKIIWINLSRLAFRFRLHTTNPYRVKLKMEKYNTLRERCPYSELFWFTFLRVLFAFFPFMKTKPETIRNKQTRLRAVNISSNIMSATNISNLLQNINEPLPVETQLDKALTWGKSLSTLPIFTRREIDLHVRKCGKLKGKSISKTSVRGRLFKHERFLSSDSVYTAFNLLYFYVKARCKASMKKELRNVRIQLCKRTGEVYKATCSCPAGKSGYCNHVMALLYETAKYSLNQLTEVPQEKACTSVLRK